MITEVEITNFATKTEPMNNNHILSPATAYAPTAVLNSEKNFSPKISLLNTELKKIEENKYLFSGLIQINEKEPKENVTAYYRIYDSNAWKIESSTSQEWIAINTSPLAMLKFGYSLYKFSHEFDAQSTAKTIVLEAYTKCETSSSQTYEDKLSYRADTIEQCYHLITEGESLGNRFAIWLPDSEKPATSGTIVIKVANLFQKISIVSEELPHLYSAPLWIRFTFDNWKTFSDYYVDKQTAINTIGKDELTYSYCIDFEKCFNSNTEKVNLKNLEFAIYFAIGDESNKKEVVWDNNFGLNYRLKTEFNLTNQPQLFARLKHDYIVKLLQPLGVAEFNILQENESLQAIGNKDGIPFNIKTTLTDDLEAISFSGDSHCFFDLDGIYGHDIVNESTNDAISLPSIKSTIKVDSNIQVSSKGILAKINISEKEKEEPFFNLLIDDYSLFSSENIKGISANWITAYHDYSALKAIEPSNDTADSIVTIKLEIYNAILSLKNSDKENTPNSNSFATETLGVLLKERKFFTDTTQQNKICTLHNTNCQTEPTCCEEFLQQQYNTITNQEQKQIESYEALLTQIKNSNNADPFLQKALIDQLFIEFANFQFHSERIFKEIEKINTLNPNGDYKDQDGNSITLDDIKNNYISTLESFFSTLAADLERDRHIENISALIKELYKQNDERFGCLIVSKENDDSFKIELPKTKETEEINEAKNDILINIESQLCYTAKRMKNRLETLNNDYSVDSLNKLYNNSTANVPGNEIKTTELPEPDDFINSIRSMCELESAPYKKVQAKISALNNDNEGVTILGFITFFEEIKNILAEEVFYLVQIKDDIKAHNITFIQQFVDNVKEIHESVNKPTELELEKTLPMS